MYWSVSFHYHVAKITECQSSACEPPDWRYYPPMFSTSFFFLLFNLLEGCTESRLEYDLGRNHIFKSDIFRVTFYDRFLQTDTGGTNDEFRSSFVARLSTIAICIIHV